MASPTLNKSLMKRLLFHSFEKLIRFEGQLDRLEHKASSGVLPYVKVLQSRLNRLRNGLFENRNTFQKLFSESPLENNSLESKLEVLMEDLQSGLQPLYNELTPLQQRMRLPELDLFLNSLSLKKLLPEAPELVVLPRLQATHAFQTEPADHLLVESLPYPSMETPLHWVGTLNTFTRYFAENTLQICSQMEEFNISQDKLDLITPILALRLLGPGYYAHYVLDAFTRLDSKALFLVEPVLFQGLNHFGLVSKDLVILHQSVEKGKHFSVMKEPRTLAKQFNNEQFRETLLKLTERVIPERLAFTEKAFMRTQLLEDRVSRGVLISAVPMFSSPAQLREEISKLDEEASLYPLLHQLKEFPATPREIVNAGWLYHLDQTSDWLYILLTEEPETGWQTIKDALADLDTLLLKSIEISEVHRVITRDEVEHPVLV